MNALATQTRRSGGSGTRADDGAARELIRQSGGSRPEPAASGNAPGSGEGGITPAQGCSADPEAPKDSVSRTGRRNGGVGRDGAGASAEPGRNRGHRVLRESATRRLDCFGSVQDGRKMSTNGRATGSGTEPVRDGPRAAVTVGGDESGTAAQFRLCTDGCKAGRPAERHDGTEEAESQIGDLPDPGSVNERVARYEIRGGHTLPRISAPTLDPSIPVQAYRSWIHPSPATGREQGRHRSQHARGFA